jgi:hypothetical protein
MGLLGGKDGDGAGCDFFLGKTHLEHLEHGWGGIKTWKML